jgi:hypothetical protein
MKLFFFLLLAIPARAQHHHDAVDHRGDKVMGFSHEKTTHHFLLAKDGGSIQVTANASTDQQSIDAIRLHLNHISTKFSAGDFNAPMLIHATTPPASPPSKNGNPKSLTPSKNSPPAASSASAQRTPMPSKPSTNSSNSRSTTTTPATP